MCWPNRAPLTAPVIRRGICAGSGFCPPSRCARLATTATLKPLTVPTGAAPDPGYRPTAKTQGVSAVAGSDVSLAGLRQAGREVRYRPHGALAGGADASVEHQALLPDASSDQDVPTGAGGWADRQLPDGTIVLTAPTGHIYTTEPHGAAMFPALGAAHRRARPPGARGRPRHRPVGDDAAAQTNPRPGPPRPHQRRTTRTHRTHRRRRTPTPSLARRQLPTTTILKGVGSYIARAVVEGKAHRLEKRCGGGVVVKHLCVGAVRAVIGTPRQQCGAQGSCVAAAALIRRRPAKPTSPPNGCRRVRR